MAELSDNLISLIAVVTLVIAAYQGAFGARQQELSEVVIKAFAVRSRYKPAVNALTSVAVALIVGSVLAMEAGWKVLPVAALAGLLASTKAAEVHDAKKAATAEPASTARTIRPLR